MKQMICICSLFLCTVALHAQNGRLAGLITDTANATGLELATVSVFNLDSSIISYKLTDRNGRFLFDKLPVRRKLLITVSYVGYITHRSVIELKNANIDTFNIALSLHTKDNNAVVVTAVAPIKMNGDTLEINPAAFKTDRSAVVEELLNQVPGITIWSDGSITVNGKKVENVLVDGKPFLGMSDTRIATQNLSKNAIDKIQLYQEYDRSKLGEQQQRPQDSLLTMNIKLKEKSKKGYFGKAGAGYGTGDRYEGDISLQAYNKSSSVGIGGGFNNINKGISNLQELFQNNTFSNINPNLYNVGRFGGSGISNNHSIGGVLTHNFIETQNSRQNNRFIGSYNKTGTTNAVTSLNLQNRTTVSNPQYIKEEGSQNVQTNRHDLSVNYVKTNSYNDNLNVSANAAFNRESANASGITEVRDGVNVLQNINTTQSMQKRISDNQSAVLSYSRNDAERPLTNFNFRVSVGRNLEDVRRDVSSVFDSYTDNTQDTTFIRRYGTKANGYSLDMNANYGGLKRLLAGRHNLFGISLRFSQNFVYRRASDDISVTDFDKNAKLYVTNNKISNQNRRDYMEYIPTLSIGKYFFKWNDKFNRNINIDVRLMNDFKTEKNISSVGQRNIDRSFQFFRYGASLNHFYQRQGKYQVSTGFNYDKRYDYPTVDNLYMIVDDINAYNIRIGNPALRNRTDHSFSANSSVNTQNPKSLYTFNGYCNAGLTRSFNAVTDSTLNDFSGKRVSYYVNADQRSNVFLNLNLNIARKFKQNTLQLMYTGSYNAGRSPNYVDGLYNVSRTQSLSNQATIQFSYGSLLILNINKSLQQYRSEQSAKGLRSFTNNNTVTKFGVTLNYPKNFAFSSTLDDIDNSNLNKHTKLWNAFITYRCMQKQGELKFSAMDILKQYQNISNSIGAYGTSTRITNGLQQFFLLTFSYYPRKFGKTELKNQQSSVR